MEIVGKSSFFALRKEFFGGDDTYGIRNFRHDDIDCVLDLGANIGMFSMQARFLFPKARVIAVEPSQDNFEVLKHNIKNLSVETHKLAYGDGSTYSMYKKHNRSVMYTFNNHIVQTEGYETCKSEILDWYFVNFGIKPDNTFVKIDVEGAEIHLMNQDITTLTRCKAVAIELHGKKQSRIMGEWLNHTFSDFHNLYWRRDPDGTCNKLNHVVMLRKGLKLIS